MASYFYSDRYALLREYFPLYPLLEHCHDYDYFYQLLQEVRQANEDAMEVKMTDSVYDELESVGVNFVEDYRNNYLMPAVTSVNAHASYLVAGATPNKQVVVLY